MARFPRLLSPFRKAWGFNSSNLFTTTNPKTEKNGKVSDRPTLVLHLEPLTFNACPAAGSCAALCLHKAGNPAYLKGKLARRHKRSQAFNADRAQFLQLLVVEAARKRSEGYVGVRLNGTSDIAWEGETVDLTPHVLEWVRDLVPSLPIRLPGTYPLIQVLTAMGFEPYDYTKRIDRDFDLCKAYGYHLTLSWGGRHDDVVVSVALRHGLNIAAGIAGVKRGHSLPETVVVDALTLPVVDGDVTDWRRDDPSPTSVPNVVGLRIKRTPGQTEDQVRRFAIA